MVVCVSPRDLLGFRLSRQHVLSSSFSMIVLYAPQTNSSGSHGPLREWQGVLIFVFVFLSVNLSWYPGVLHLIFTETIP